MSQILRSILYFIILGLLTWYAMIYLPQSDLADFAIYRQSAQGLLKGEDIYQPYVSVKQGEVELELKYLYPPSLAVVLSWLERILGDFWVKLAWMHGALLSIIFSAYFIAQLVTERYKKLALRGPGSVVESKLHGLDRIANKANRLEPMRVLVPEQIFPLIFVFISVWPPTLDGLMWGQVNPYILLLICLALLSEARSKFLLAGLFIGFATALKGSPIILALPWLLGHNWRALSGVCLAGVASLVISGASPRGYLVIIDFLRSLRMLATENVINDPFYDYALKKVYGNEVGLIVAGLILAMFIAVIFTLRRQGSKTCEVQIVCGVPVMIALAPCVWFHHFIWLIVPIIFSYMALDTRRGLKEMRGLILSGYCLFLGLSLYLHVILRNQMRLDANLFKMIIPILILLPIFLIVIGERGRKH